MKRKVTMTAYGKGWHLECASCPYQPSRDSSRERGICATAVGEDVMWDWRCEDFQGKYRDAHCRVDCSYKSPTSEVEKT